MDADIRTLIVESLQVFWLGILPPLLLVGVVSLLFSVFQAASTVRDQSTLYAARLVTLVLLLYFLVPAVFRSLEILVERLWTV
ncbi:MAG: flagellar biosynthetic protein FliQ [Bdellovibrionales bacterium]|nr:flagellar biosynthetic protein FliQ [Bdellovibrionales bacterium]